MCAVKASLEEGVVIGGGALLAKISEKLRKQEPENSSQAFLSGYKIVAEAILAPFKQICSNAGVEFSRILYSILEFDSNNGYDAKSDEIVDLMESGIIDPAKVTRVAVENAVNVASMFLSTDCVIAEVSDDGKGN